MGVHTTGGGPEPEGSRESGEPLTPRAPLGGIGSATDGTDRDGIDRDDVRRAQRGDAWALDRVVRVLEPYLGRICGAIALEAGDDALQETMIAVVTNVGSLREPGALHGWARRIAVREAVRVARGGRAVPVDPAAFDTRMPSQEDGATAVDVRDVLVRLAPEQRAVLVLRHMEGLGEQEMADLLGVAPGTVKSRLNRARGAFRRRWQA